MKENEDYGMLTPTVQAHVSMMAILGALTGQIIFGVLGDQVCVRCGIMYADAWMHVGKDNHHLSTHLLHPATAATTTTTVRTPGHLPRHRDAHHRRQHPPGHGAGRRRAHVTYMHACMQASRQKGLCLTSHRFLHPITACIHTQPLPNFNIYSQMMLYRFIMGLGVGGEYPAASTITSENSNPLYRGRNLAAVFSMQVGGSMVWGLGTTRREAN